MPGASVAPPRIPAVLGPADIHVSDLGDESSFSGVAIAGSRLAGADAPGLTFAESTLTRIDLTESRLLRLSLSDVTLGECNFSNSRTKSPSFRRVRFAQCKLTGFALDSGSLGDVVLSDTLIDFARFDGMKLKNVRFERCQMRDVDFENTTLEQRGLVHLRGMAMEWNDVTEHADLFAAELGVRII